MKISNYIRSVALASFTLGAAILTPSTPAVAAAPCYEAVLFCKYHSDHYPSFAACIAEESLLLCPDSFSRLKSSDLLGKIED